MPKDGVYFTRPCILGQRPYARNIQRTTDADYDIGRNAQSWYDYNDQPSSGSNWQSGAWTNKGKEAAKKTHISYNPLSATCTTGVNNAFATATATGAWLGICSTSVSGTTERVWVRAI